MGGKEGSRGEREDMRREDGRLITLPGGWEEEKRKRGRRGEKMEDQISESSSHPDDLIGRMDE